MTTADQDFKDRLYVSWWWVATLAFIAGLVVGHLAL